MAGDGEWCCGRRSGRGIGGDDGPKGGLAREEASPWVYIQSRAVKGDKPITEEGLVAERGARHAGNQGDE